MKDWRKLSVPALIFVPMMLMMITGCQTPPSSASQDVIEETNENTVETACKHFATPDYTVAEIRALPGPAQHILGLWDGLLIAYGCD